MVQYRNGWIDSSPCTAAQRDWTDAGYFWDIVAVKRV